MALKIVWTRQAEKGLDNVLEYLQEEWSVKEILALEKRILALMERISKYPKSVHPEESTRICIKDLWTRTTTLSIAYAPEKRPLRSSTSEERNKNP